MQAFRLAIAGAGLITRGSHLPAALASTKVQLVALVDPVVERAESLCRDYGLSIRVAGDVAQVLDGVDGVLIATPNDSHARIACTCLQAGVSVLVEKPLASNLQEGLSILEEEARSKATVAVAYVTRFRDSTVFLKEILDEGSLGRVDRFVHQFGTAGGWAPLSGYNLKSAAAGGGVLIVTGTHFIDRMIHYWGVPEAVTFESDSMGGPEANCFATFQYKRAIRDMRGAVIYSKTSRLPGGLVIETDRGRVRVLDSEGAEIEWYPNDAPTRMHVIRRRGPSRFPRGEDAFMLQIEDFVKAVQTGGAPMVSGEQGVESLRLIDRLYAVCTRMNTDWYSSAAGLGVR